MLDMADELTDRFGPLPQSVSNLLNIAYIRNLAGILGVSVIKEDNGNTVLIYPKPDIEIISRAAGEFKDKCLISASKFLCVILKTKGLKDDERVEFIKNYLEVCQNILNE